MQRSYVRNTVIFGRSHLHVRVHWQQGRSVRIGKCVRHIEAPFLCVRVVTDTHQVLSEGESSGTSKMLMLSACGNMLTILKHITCCFVKCMPMPSLIIGVTIPIVQDSHFSFAGSHGQANAEAKLRTIVLAIVNEAQTA